ncbi:MAG: aldose 1-epimerase family protein [Verrucomicrobiota bacterium]|nr:aldose 1-epimerase family protein [Verrucomicrobiota bacterium]
MTCRSSISLSLLALLSATALTADLVTIENSWLRVSVDPLGAELQSIRHINTDTEYLWQGDPDYWENRAPVMFPVNVRFKDNQFSYKGKSYEMPRMGLAVISEFETFLSEDGEAVTLSLAANEMTRTHYPFEFVFDVTYRLTGNRLVNEYRVSNNGSETLLFAMGGHPGFRTPFNKGRSRGDYEISFSKRLNLDRVEINDSLIQTSRVPFLQDERKFTLDDPRIPGGGMFLEDMPARKIGVGLDGMLPYVTVDLGDFPNVNIWTPPGMPFVCIEPMVAHHDIQDSPLAIDKKPFLIPVKAGEAKTYAFSIIVTYNGDLD